MHPKSATENLQVIRTLMERSALYRRALAPIMLIVGAIGSVAGGLGCFLESDSVFTFVLFWLATGFLALGLAFLLVRRQALRDKEPFWSGPTRRVALALTPPLFAGLVLSVLILLFWNSSTRVLWKPDNLPGLWMILYGCSLHSAGFFVTRGVRWLGALFILLGLVFLSGRLFPMDSVNQLHLSMGATFGGLHLACGAYLYFTEKPKSDA